ncbi:MAG: YqzL family protein [Clostridiales bacterium]|nr:YqzL family protein [Clostridiales bacterium]
MRKNNKQEKGKKQKKANDLAWDLFSQSGNIAHYLLYKELNDKRY